MRVPFHVMLHDSMPALTADEVIARLKLDPLPNEGGYFRETYRATGRSGAKSISTAIYYLITPTSFSAMHRLPTDEVWHFYLGDPVEQLRLYPDGTSNWVTLGCDLNDGHCPQTVVPGGIWQASRLIPGGAYALLGTTIAPGFEFTDFELGDKQALTECYPKHRQAIAEFLS